MADLKHDRVGAWNEAVRVCPYCTEGEDCHMCQGTRDLFGLLLLKAYERGRDDAVLRMGEVAQHAVSAYGLVATQTKQQAQIAWLLLDRDLP